jgi:hypothetical protein
MVSAVSVAKDSDITSHAAAVGMDEAVERRCLGCGRNRYARYDVGRHDGGGRRVRGPPEPARVLCTYTVLCMCRQAAPRRRRTVEGVPTMADAQRRSQGCPAHLLLSSERATGLPLHPGRRLFDPGRRAQAPDAQERS